MPKKRGISHESRARAVLKLKTLQQIHPEGCTVTRLAQKLGWRNKETEETVEDLVQSGMIYGDYVSQWARTHLKGSKLPRSGAYLLKVSPYGDEFLRLWNELTRMAESRDHHYSEME